MEASVQLETHLGVSKARRMLSDLLDKVHSGGLRVIDRREASVALVDAEMMDFVLARAFPFNPEVYFGEESGVAIWLPELEVFGEGEDLEGAQEALLDAVLDYVPLWEEELRRAPNHVQRFGWVYRIQLAERPERIREMLFEEREATNLRPTPSLL